MLSIDFSNIERSGLLKMGGKMKHLLTADPGMSTRKGEYHRLVREAYADDELRHCEVPQ
jgi:hypothetical protein